MAVEQVHLRADARRNRERIVTAAAACFASDGIECQVAEIARRAGVGNATVFRHFPTKRDLLTAVVTERIEGMLRVADEALEVDDPRAALRMLLDEIVRVHVEDSALKQVAAGQFAGDERMRAMRDALLGRLATLVDRAKAAGLVRADAEPIDFVVLANGVATAVAGLEEQRPGLRQRYFEIAFAGMRPPAEDAPPLPASAPTADEVEAAMMRSDPPACG